MYASCAEKVDDVAAITGHNRVTVLDDECKRRIDNILCTRPSE